MTVKLPYIKPYFSYSVFVLLNNQQYNCNITKYVLSVQTVWWHILCIYWWLAVECFLSGFYSRFLNICICLQCDICATTTADHLHLTASVLQQLRYIHLMTLVTSHWLVYHLHVLNGRVVCFKWWPYFVTIPHPTKNGVTDMWFAIPPEWMGHSLY